MQSNNKYYKQFQNYYLSNLALLNILKNDNKQEYNKNWRDDLFFPIPLNYILNWQNLIGFMSICEKIKLNYNKITNHKINQINKYLLINESKNNTNPIDKLNFKSLYDSFLGTSKNISPDSDFYLVTKNSLDSFVDKNSNQNTEKLLIRIGNKKIVVNINNNLIIFYIEKKENNENKENIQPYNLINFIKKTTIETEDKNAQMNELINDIIKMDIYDFFREVNYPKKGNNENNKYIYKNIVLIILGDKTLKVSFNLGPSIPTKISSISQSFIQDAVAYCLNYVNTIIVKKIKNSSYIIASMYSFAYIKSIVEYFFDQKKNTIIETSTLLILFRNYIYMLIKKNEENEKFIPQDFIRYLNKYYNQTFDLKEEKEPIIFIKTILDCLNDNLNNKDNTIKKIIKDSKNEFKNDKQFEKFYLEKFIPRYNSIISKLFYGIFQIKNECCLCGGYKEYEIFNYIDINIQKYCDYNKDNSLIYYYFDDLIDFYFNENQYLEDKDSKIECTKCKQKELKNIKTERIIIKFPEILIFNINWGKFNVCEGFGLEYNKLIFEENQIIDLKNYSSNKEKQIEYRLKSVINYPIINDSNKEDKSFKKFITFSRHINNKDYFFQPSGLFRELTRYNRIKFAPSVLFYERIN